MRSIRSLIDEAMKQLDWLFGSIYAAGGRESIPPERLIRAHGEHLNRHNVLVGY